MHGLMHTQAHAFTADATSVACVLTARLVA